MEESNKSIVVIFLTAMMLISALKWTKSSGDQIKNIKLYYFPLNGRAEIIRMILHQAGVPFEDVRVTKDQWVKVKPMDSPWGQLPYVEIDGKFVGQSLTIARYFAEKFGLAGESEFERVKCDEAAEAVLDMRRQVKKAVTISINTRNLVQAQEEFIPGEETVRRILKRMDKQIFENKSGFLVGNKICWADLFLADHAMKFQTIKPDILNDTQNVIKLYQTVLSLPNIKQYHQSPEYLASIS